MAADLGELTKAVKEGFALLNQNLEGLTNKVFQNNPDDSVGEVLVRLAATIHNLAAVASDQQNIGEVMIPVTESMAEIAEALNTIAAKP